VAALFFGAGTWTLKQAAQQMAPSTDFHMLGACQLPSGKTIVLYHVVSDNMSGKPPMTMFGYVEIKRSGLEWQPRSGGAQGIGDGPPPAGTFVIYN
jgi:hypothetical protein